MKRGDFVMELLRLWEESADKLERERHYAAAVEVRTAIGVLEKTYKVDELELTFASAGRPNG